MCAESTEERITLEEIRAHPFFTSEDIASEEEILTDYKVRYMEVLAIREVER